MREVVLAVLLFLAAVLVTVGVVVLFGAGVGFMVAGVLLAGWGWLVAGDIAEDVSG